MGIGSVALAALITLAARAMQPGELVVVNITTAGGLPSAAGAPAAKQPCAVPCSVRVRAFDREIPSFAVDDRRWRAFVGIDLDTPPGAYHIRVDVDGVETKRDLVVVRKTFPTRRLTVDPDFVTPPVSERARIERETALLAAAWDASSPTRFWSAPFAAPVTEKPNSAFGTRSVFNGERRNAHGGADFLSPAGTPIRAPNAGRVVIARTLYFSGNTVVIDHGLGVFSMLAHLSAFDVKEGDIVSPGQRVGRVGATGRVTGAHLHWAVRINGARVDPLSLIALAGQP